VSAPLPPHEFERARRLLMRRDRRLAELIKRVGPCRLPESRQREPFLGLVRVVLAQQLSAKAAQTIFNRVIALAKSAGLKTGGSIRTGGSVATTDGSASLTPVRLLDIDPDALRGAGVSRPKIAYLRDLAERVSDGRLPLDALETMPDEEVIAAITAVKGFGRWSAEMFLIFRLNRPDVLPLTDLGIIKGMQMLFGMKRRPAARTMIRLAEPWRPYRSVASWYLWRLHD
jgi:3-methyladenine DNA glycosylase/8-oxoguanine DNA glycosylase